MDGLESYFAKLHKGFDLELLAVQQELEVHKAAARELEAQEVILPAAESDDLSNYFLECIYQERKSLRHQLLTMRNGTNIARGGTQSQRKTMGNVFNNSLLNIYINTVKTGS